MLSPLRRALPVLALLSPALGCYGTVSVRGGGASRNLAPLVTGVGSIAVAAQEESDAESSEGDEPSEEQPLPELRRPTQPKRCPRPASASRLETFYRDSMGYSIPDNTRLTKVTIHLKKGESLSVGGSSCAYFEDVTVEGGPISIGGKAVAVLTNVKVKGAREALDVGGSAEVTVRGGAFDADGAVSVGGSARLEMIDSAASGETALTAGGDAELHVQGSRLACDRVGTFDECVSVGGGAVVWLDDVTSKAAGRSVSVGGDAFVLLTGGEFTSGTPGLGASAFDAMGEATLVLLGVERRGETSVSGGGGGRIFVRAARRRSSENR